MAEQRCLPYIVEPMRVADVDQVMEIEMVAFGTPWSARAYRYEINENEHSTMLVARCAPPETKGLARWLPRPGINGRAPVLSYGGFWLLIDEAHISTIATHPDWRGRGLGELLLLSLLDRAIEQGALLATLEVRVSNQAAMSLYQRYLFQIVGRRKDYYSDNNEDAYIMTTPRFDSPEFQANLAACRSRLLARIGGVGAFQTIGGKPQKDS